MKKSVTSNVIYNMLFQFFTTFLPVITTPYLSRTLGVSQSGVYSFVESIVTLFTVFGAIGTSLYGCRMIAYVRDDKQKLSQTAYEIFMLKFLILIPVIIIYIVLFCISGKYSIYFIVNILTVIGSAIEISWFFNGVEDFKLVTMRNFIIKIIFVVCLFIFIKSPDDLFKYVLLVCVSNFIGNLSMWICLPKYLLSIRKIEKLKPFKHLKESFKLFIPQSANYVYSLSDKTMLGILTPTLDNVGIYDYSYRIVKMIISILQSIGYVILSRIANLSSKKDNEGIKKYIYKSINFSLFLALPMMFGLIGISNTFVPLYLGSEFIEVSKVIIIISPLVIITSFNSILGVQLLLAIKKDKQYTIATVSGAIINILLNLIFIPVLGIYGACITSLFSEICVLIIQLYYSKEFISVMKILKDNIKPFVFSIIIVLICNLISIININALLVLLLQIIISSLVYFALMFFFKDEIFMEILSKTMSLFKKKRVKKGVHSMKKKKILFIIWSFTYGGGAEKILANLVNKLDSNKYDIDIIEYWHSNIHTEKVNSNIRILKPIVDSTKASKIRMLITKIILEKFPFILRKIYIKDKYDYEIAFNSMIPTFLLDKKAKTISWNHGDLYSLKEKKHDMKLQKKSFKYVNKIVAISKNTYESILDVFPEYKDKTLIINNSFDFDNILKLSSEQIEIKKEKFTLLFAGRFDENKNPLFLIEVCKKLKLLNKDFQLWFIGKGKLESKINEEIEKNNLKEYVKILGFKSNPYPYFKSADIVTMSSHHEGFPTVLAEGLYLGKPFISTKVGGIEELSDNGKCGIISSNVDDYSNKLLKLMNDKKTLSDMGNYGKTYIKKFTYEKQIQKLEKLFEEMDNE